MAIKPRSNRKFIITADDNGDFLELGPAGKFAGTFAIQFNPDEDSDYEVVVMGRVMGQSAVDAEVPALPIPYRRVTVNNVASDRALVSDPVSGASKIEVPSNGDSISLLVSCTAGRCTVVSWPLQGSPT